MYKPGVSQVSKNMTDKIISEGRALEFPLDLLPEKIKNWYEAISFAANTRPEFVFLSSLCVVNSILGPKTVIEVRAGSSKESVKNKRKPYHELPGMFLVLLCEPGSGKSNAFNLTVQHPLSDQTDDILKSLQIQDYTKKGLFESLRSHYGKGLLASAEMQNFFDGLIRKQNDGYGERNMLNTLYDGSTQWIMTSAARKVGEKENREELKENSFSICGFAQPEPFINAYKALAALKDGFTDRLLVCTIKPQLLFEEETTEWEEKLEEFNLHSFHTVYNKIYNLHKNGRKYTFSQAAKALYCEYSDEVISEANKIWNEGQILNTNYSKDRRNLCRLSLGLQVLLKTLDLFLDNSSEEEMVLAPEDIPLEVDLDVVELAKSFVQYFRKQKDILNMVYAKPGVDKRVAFAKPDCKQNMTTENDLQVREQIDTDFKKKVTEYVVKVLEDNTQWKSYMIVRKDGLVIRAKDAAGFPYSNEELTLNLAECGVSGQTKSYYFDKQKKRSHIIPWSFFTVEECERIQKLAGESITPRLVTNQVDFAKKENNNKESTIEEINQRQDKGGEKKSEDKDNDVIILDDEAEVEKDIDEEDASSVMREENKEEKTTPEMIDEDGASNLPIDGASNNLTAASKEVLKLKDSLWREVETGPRSSKYAKRK